MSKTAELEVNQTTGSVEYSAGDWHTTPSQSCSVRNMTTRREGEREKGQEKRKIKRQNDSNQTDKGERQRENSRINDRQKLYRQRGKQERVSATNMH